MAADRRIEFRKYIYYQIEHNPKNMPNVSMLGTTRALSCSIEHQAFLSPAYIWEGTVLLASTRRKLDRQAIQPPSSLLASRKAAGRHLRVCLLGHANLKPLSPSSILPPLNSVNSITMEGGEVCKEHKSRSHKLNLSRS